MTDNYYRILGLANTATKEKVKKAYREKLKLYHPDVNIGKPIDTTRETEQIIEAYDYIMKHWDDTPKQEKEPAFSPAEEKNKRHSTEQRAESGGYEAANTTSAMTYKKRGDSFREQNDYYNAIRNYDEAIKLKPDYAFAYYGRALAYSDSGKKEQAINDYSEAIRLKPDFASAFNNRGVIYADSFGNRNQAILDYNNAITLEPDEAIYYYNRGHSYYRKKEYVKAIDDFNNALRLNPDYTAAKEMLQQTYSLKRRQNIAKSIFIAGGIILAVLSILVYVYYQYLDNIMTSLSTEGGKAIRLIIFIVIFALYGYASRDENIFTGAIGAGAGYLFSNLFNHIVSIFPYFMLSLLAGSFAVAGIGVSYNRRLVKNTARRMFYLFFSIIIIASFFQGMFYLFFTMIFVTVLFHHITK